MEKGRAATIRDERACKRTLGMGTLVFESRTSTARPLPPEAVAALVDAVREYREICARDGGTIVAAGATQWARDATNIAEVASAVKAATAVQIDVLSPRQEAEYSYAAASVNTPGRLVLDAGSNSFELAWQEKGSAVGSVTVPHGYGRAAEVAAFLRGIRAGDFTTLKGEPVRTLYGQKALVVPALVDLLLRELGARRLVVVPQEGTTGHILTRLSAPSNRSGS